MYTLSYYVYTALVSFFSHSSLKHAGFLCLSSATMRNKVSFCGNFNILMTNVRSEDVHRKES